MSVYESGARSQTRMISEAVRELRSLTAFCMSVCSSTPCRLDGAATEYRERPFREAKMMGVIAGDVVGSVYERRPTKSTRFPAVPSRLSLH